MVASANAMPRYDDIYEITARRAVSKAELAFDGLVGSLQAAGMSEDRIIERLTDDLRNEGPVFGRLLRDLGAAGNQAILSAKRQGVVVGSVRANPAVVAKISAFNFDLDRAAREPDPELAFDIEKASGRHRDLMWVAELRKTCIYCLPFHGTVLTGAEWLEEGQHPDTIHSENAIDNPCYCDLIETEVIADRDKALAPLKRVDVPDARKGEGRLNRRTVRDMSSKSVETSIKARNDLVKSIEGRRMLRVLGQVMEE